MDSNKSIEQIEREVIGTEFVHSMEVRNHENSRRGAIRINQADLLKAMENSDAKGMDISPKSCGEIVTDSESDED